MSNIRKSMRSRGRKSFRNTSPQHQYDKRQILIPIVPPTRDQPFNPNQYLVAQCSLKDIEQYKQIFDYLDGDQDGKLCPYDFRKVTYSFHQAMIKLGGYNPQKIFVFRMIAQFDQDQRGQINFKQFIKMMTTKLCQHQSSSQIKKVFQQIDAQGKGYIDANDLKQLNDYLIGQLSNEDIHQMIRACDPDGKGVITWEAFLAFNKKRDF